MTISRSRTSTTSSSPTTTHITATGISNEKLGMWVYLASDCLLFGGLISTYLHLPATARAQIAGPRRAPREDLRALQHPVHVDDVVHPADELAHDGARRELDRAQATSTRMRLWLGATAVLGGAVPRRSGVRVHRVRATRASASPRTSSSSAFFTLTGFHGVHVRHRRASCCCRRSTISMRRTDQGRGGRGASGCTGTSSTSSGS